jgi:hypothetical protein
VDKELMAVLETVWTNWLSSDGNLVNPSTPVSQEAIKKFNG